MLKLLLKKTIKIAIVALLALAFLVLGNLYTYKRLISEKPIAQLTFTPISSQVFDASLRLGNFCEQKSYRVYGDEWRIDAQFLKWKSWATLFGLDAMYRIDRLSGRYENIDDENTKLHSAHELKTDSTLDLAEVAERYKNKLPPVDTIYGSSAYEKMQPNTLYTIFVTQSGILARKQPYNDKEPTDCVDGKSAWKDGIVQLDQKLAALLDRLL